MSKNLLKFPIFFIFFLFLLFTSSQQTKAVVQIDASSSAGNFDGVAINTPLTWSHTVGGGISRALFVSVSTSVTVLPGSALARVSSVTYNGIALTRVGTQTSPLPTPNNAVEMFRLVNPPSGTANIEVTLVAFSANYVVGTGVSFTGVDQANPNSGFQSNNANTNMPNVLVTGAVPDDIVFDAVSSSFNAQSFIVGANQSVCFPTMAESDCRRGRRFFPPGGGGISDVGASSTEPGATNVTMSWLLANGAHEWAIGAVAVKAFVPSSANGEISGRVLTSQGRGIPRVSISVSGGDGVIKTARTNPFGYFKFTDLEIGNTYILQPNSKKYVFSPQVVTLNDSINDLYLYPVGK